MYDLRLLIGDVFVPLNAHQSYATDQDAIGAALTEARLLKDSVYVFADGETDYCAIVSAT